MKNVSETVKDLQEQRGDVVRQVKRLDEAIKALMKLVGRNHARGPGSRGPKPRMSAAGRRRIAAAQRARWARWKAKRAKKAA